ncbi:MAG: DUF5985 family protein [Gammaproteobacteria bacterium]
MVSALAVESSFIGLLLLSRWMGSGERFLGILGIAFCIMACNWICLITLSPALEFGHLQSLLRILAFTLVIVGLVCGSRRRKGS